MLPIIVQLTFRELLIFSGLGNRNVVGLCIHLRGRNWQIVCADVEKDRARIEP